ncbi:hypothetical protein WA026_004991 [Henosepilachna vigintioctopunctata]|uniref:ERAP1-like C-terminal domain-containing protein n=1 Tax=Henosepilachna vigintioctopunctata TaxID=420089 RepID=A0AAW1UWU3_9CUCU
MDNFEEFTDDDQGNLIDDAFHLTRERLLPCRIPLKLIGNMKNSTKLLPVTVSLSNIRMILNDAKGHSQIFEKLKAYFADIFENLYDKLSWSVNPDEDLNTRNLRTNLLEIMCGTNMNYDRCFNDVLSISKNNSFTLHSDLLNLFTETYMKLEKIKRTKAKQKYNLKSIFSYFLGNKIPVPHYISECSPWILENL